MAHVAKRKMPDLEFDWIRNLAMAIGAFLAYLGFVAVLLWLIPPRIEINRKGISRQQGRTPHWRLRADIRRIVVDTTDGTKPTLSIESNRKPLAAGIASKISVTELIAFLRDNFPEALIEKKSK